MKYAYEDLSDKQFELLALFICQQLLGIGVQGFADGRDGGRDAKFMGKAERHPSMTSPWTGTTIIQAKHTNGYNRQFGETDFFNPKSNNTIVGKEIPRIQSLRKAKELDNYMLFSNRRLAGDMETKIRNHIAEKCNIHVQSIALFGIEQLEIFLKTYPDIPDKVDLDPIDSPLIVSPDELSEVVQAIAKSKDALAKVLDDPPVPRVTYADKNVANNMTADYAQFQLTKSLKETAQIAGFLAAPENLELQELYNSVVDEFQAKIIAKRKDYQTFDSVMEYLIDLLYNRDAVLRQRQHKRITRAVLFYMYWNCDIGKVPDAATN
ncbi:MAG: ABC-three component system protein [Rhodomicrobium sp.]